MTTSPPTPSTALAPAAPAQPGPSIEPAPTGQELVPTSMRVALARRVSAFVDSAHAAHAHGVPY